MSELRSESLREIGRQIADAAINAGMAVMVSDFEKHTRLSNKVELLMSELGMRDAALGDSGRVIVDRARFERLLELARWADSYDGASGERNGLQPGDLDSLE